MTILRAAHNPRFCGPLAMAESNLKNGCTGDFLQFMGGFAAVAFKAAPGANLNKTHQAISGKADVNSTVDALLSGYNDVVNTGETAAKRLAAWQAFETGMNFTEEEKNKICKQVVLELRIFCDQILTGTVGENALVMVRSTNNRSLDVDKYGVFGKCGTTPLEPKDFWQGHIYVASGYQIWKGLPPNELFRKNIPSIKGQQRVLQAILTMAEAIVAAGH